MNEIRKYPILVFFILGFFFQGQFLNALILSIVWELIDDCLDKGLSTSNIYDHLNEYKTIWKQDPLSKQNKVIDLLTNLSGYYGGHFPEARPKGCRNRPVVPNPLSSHCASVCRKEGKESF